MAERGRPKSSSVPDPRRRGRKRDGPTGHIRAAMLPEPPGLSDRTTTLQLLGCFLMDQRQKAGVSPDVFASDTGRAVGWLVSVERGECAPTPSGYASLSAGFRNAKIPIGIPLHRLTTRLEEDPFGTIASGLRKRYGIPYPTPEPMTAEPPGLLPLVHEVRHKDRVLTLAPLILLAAVAGFFIVAQAWHGEGVDFMKPDFQAIAFLGAGIIAGLSLVVPRLSQRLVRICRRTRTGEVNYWYDQVSEIRKDEGAVESVGEWYLPAEAVYLIPRHRARARWICLEADLCERLIVVFGAGFLGGAASLGLALVESTVPRSWVPWAVSMLIFVGLVAWTAGRRLTLVSNIPDVLNDGYGVPPESPDPRSGITDASSA